MAYYQFISQAVQSGLCGRHPITEWIKKETILCPAHYWIVYKQGDKWGFFKNEKDEDVEVVINKRNFKGLKVPFFGKKVVCNMYLVPPVVKKQRKDRTDLKVQAGNKTGLFDGWYEYELKVVDPIQTCKYVESINGLAQYGRFMIFQLTDYALNEAIKDCMNKGLVRTGNWAQDGIWWDNWERFLKEDLFRRFGCVCVDTNLSVRKFVYL